MTDEDVPLEWQSHITCPVCDWHKEVRTFKGEWLTPEHMARWLDPLMLEHARDHPECINRAGEQLVIKVGYIYHVEIN